MRVFRNKKKLAFAFVCVLFLGLRLPGLGSDITNSDAVRWHHRSENFLQAIKSSDFKSTYQRYHPGVTLMWINAVVKQVAFSYQLRFTDNPQTLNNADWYPVIHGISKGVNVLVLFSLLLLQIHLLAKLFGLRTGLLYGFFASAEPYFIGINRWFHLSSFEVMFVFSSILALMVWHELPQDGKKPKFIFLGLSAIMFGLSVLSKVTSLVMIPVLLYVFFQDYRVGRNLKVVGRSILIFSGLVTATLFLLFPALIAEPVYVLSKIYQAVFGAVSTDVRNTLLPGYIKPFYFSVISLFKLSPITLMLSMLALLKYRRGADPKVRVLLLILFVYNLVFIPASQKIDRYIVMFFPTILTLVALYVSELSKKLKVAVFFSVMVFLSWTGYFYHPVYSAYYSPIFGGAAKALQVGIYENSGEYFAQAAVYLNEKGRDTKVYVPDNIDSFSYYYKGKVVGSSELGPDYMVRSLDIDRKRFDNLGCPDLEAYFGPRNFHSVAVFKCEKM